MAYWTPAGLQKLAQSESGGRADLIHYPSGVTPSGVKSSASGLYGFLDSTWQEQSKNVPGADQYARAYQAPASVQTAVALQTPTSHWTCDGCNATASSLAQNPDYVTGTPDMTSFPGSEVPSGTTVTDGGMSIDAPSDFAPGSPGGSAPSGNPTTGQVTTTMPAQGLPGETPAYNPTGLEAVPKDATGKPTTTLIPDVGNAIKSGFGSISDTIGAAVNNTIASAEAYLGRGFVMLLAIGIFLAAAWMMVPRETKQAAVRTAAAA